MITPSLLIELERKYAPTVGAAPAVFSPHERTRTDSHNAGGDKMGSDRNGYAEAYAAVLQGLDPEVVVELGVFQGVSIAVWCDLYPNSMVVGLDLDFDRYRANLRNLTGRGAFLSNRPVLKEWDAYAPEFPHILAGIDIFVDDGPHTADAIRNTLRVFAPLIRPGGVYVVEDFPSGDSLLAESFPEATISRHGRLNAALL